MFEARRTVFQSCGTKIVGRERYKHNMEKSESKNEEEEILNDNEESLSNNIYSEKHTKLWTEYKLIITYFKYMNREKIVGNIIGRA